VLYFHACGVIPVAHIICIMLWSAVRAFWGSARMISLRSLSGPGALPRLRLLMMSLNAVGSAMADCSPGLDVSSDAFVVSFMGSIGVFPFPGSNGYDALVLSAGRYSPVLIVPGGDVLFS